MRGCPVSGRTVRGSDTLWSEGPGDLVYAAVHGGHGYDDEIAYHAIEDITREHVLNHVLRSRDFYKLYALSDRPFPGYR